MTHKKLILMALMGVMLSDAEARLERKQKGSALSARGRGRGARGRPQMNSDNTGEPTVKMDNEGGGFVGDQDDGGNRPAKGDPDPAPAQQNNEQNNTSTQDNPKLDEDKLAAKFKVSPNVKTGLELKDDQVDGYAFLSKALGTTENQLNEVKGQGSRLKAWAALGENDQRVGEILPGQVAYDIIKAAAEGSDLRPKMDATNVSRDGGNNIIFGNSAGNKEIKFGTATYQLVDGKNYSATADTTTVPAQLQIQYDAFVKALGDVVLWNAKGEAIEFNVESKADFPSELLSVGAAKATAAMQSVIRNAYKTAVDSFVDQLKSKTAKEKLFLPVLTASADKVALAAQPTANIKGFAAGSSVDGIEATDNNAGFALRLIDIKKGAKKNILDTSSGMMAYDATHNPTGATDDANPKLSAFITDAGVKAFKKAVELYYGQEVDKKSEFSLEKLLNDISAEARKEVNTTGLQKARAENKKDKIDAEKEKIAKKMEAIVRRSMSKQGLSRFANAVPKDAEDMVG